MDRRRSIPGLDAPGTTGSDSDATTQIRGSTTILQILRRHPEGTAAHLMADIHWPCAHCGGAVREPLTLAARRHQRDARAVLEAFRALDIGYPDDSLVAAARERHPDRWRRTR
jgi:hypothetical protein